MLRVAVGLALAAFVCAVSVACEPPPSRPRPPATEEERFEVELARAACAGVSSCCVSRKLGAFDVDTCESLVRGTLSGIQRVRSGSVAAKLDPARAAACLAKVQRYGATCVDPEQGLGVLDASPCDAVFTGGRGAGEACQVTEECGAVGDATRALCDEHHHCELLRPAREGATCLGDCDDDDCTDLADREGAASGAKARPVERPEHDGPASASKRTPAAVEPYCDTRARLTCDAERHVCRAPAAVATACDPKHACEAGAYCRDLRCVNKGGLGTSCAGAVDACAAQFACDPGSKTCVAKKRDGEVCSDDADCASDNCAGRLCRSRTDATMLRIGRTLRLFCSPE